MLNSAVLDVAIGLIFVYLALSLMCTTVNEWVAQMFAMRPKTLKQGIDALLHHSPLNSASFAAAEIDSAKLLKRLTAPGDRLARALGFDPVGTPALIMPDSSELPAVREALAARLNQVLSDPQLYQKVDLTRVGKDTLNGAKKQLTDEALETANAKLLREAYPAELGSLANAFYSHPLVQSLSRAGGYPAYLSSKTFSTVLTDLLGKRRSLEDVVSAIDNLPDSSVKHSLLALVPSSGATLAEFETELQEWFDRSMDRVSGWYKRKVQVVTILIAAVITIWANADTVGIAQKLFAAPVVRQQLIQSKTSEPGQLTAAQKSGLDALTGWGSEFVVFHRMKAGNFAAPSDNSFPGTDLISSPQLSANWLWAIIPGHILGWALTAMAVSLGAPFWFDTLNKFMNIRAAGTAPNEKGKDKSKA